MAELLGKIGYREVPSSAVDYLELDFDNIFVKITFKSNLNVQYCYKCEDLDEFQSSFMLLSGQLEAEQDRDDEDNVIEPIEATIEREDASIGKFINQRIGSGNLKLDSRLEQNRDMLARGWDAFTGSTMPDDAVVTNMTPTQTEEEVAQDSLQSGTNAFDIASSGPIIEESSTKEPNAQS